MALVAEIFAIARRITVRITCEAHICHRILPNQIKKIDDFATASLIYFEPQSFTPRHRVIQLILVWRNCIKYKISYRKKACHESACHYATEMLAKYQLERIEKSYFSVVEPKDSLS